MSEDHLWTSTNSASEPVSLLIVICILLLVIRHLVISIDTVLVVAHCPVILIDIVLLVTHRLLILTGLLDVVRRVAGVID